MIIDEEREKLRLTALYSLGVPDGLKSIVFDRIVDLAIDIFDVPFSTITFVDKDRQVYFSKTGISLDSTLRSESICTHTVDEDRILVIRDLSTDGRWRECPAMIEGAQLSFYAGVPIHLDDQPIGTLCLMDHRPHLEFADSHAAKLWKLALIVEDLLVLIRDETREAESVPAKHFDSGVLTC